jgi:cytochrome c peroxidase
MTQVHRMFGKKLAVAAALSGAAVAVLATLGCGGGGLSVTDTAQASTAWRWSLPAGFPTPAVPADNPMSEAKVDLGRYLFYDRRLSGNQLQSCASCHHQDKAFTDGRVLAIGSTGHQHPRNAQPLANAAYHPTLTWANPSLLTLEKQMEVPLFSEDPVEMGVNDSNKGEILLRLKSVADYPAKFAAAFPGESDPVSWLNIVKSIASFQRALISGNSRYDQFQAGKPTLNAQELRGMNLFFGEKAECFHCHGSFNFNDQVVHATTRVLETPFHNTGLYNIDGNGGFPQPNRGVFETHSDRPENMGKFRAQSLRNIEVTAPYMHDGSIATLEEVVDFYAAGGRDIREGPNKGDGRLNPYKSDFIQPIDLSAQEKADLVAFLKTLTDHEFLTNPKFSDPFAAGR